MTGLLYSQYFGALLLPVLGLFHLLFVPKNRRWWRTVLLPGLAALISALQLPAFINGLAIYRIQRSTAQYCPDDPQLLAQFLRYLVNDLISPTLFVATLLAILLPLALLVATVLRLRARRPVGAGWLLAFVSATLLLLYVVSNEALRIVSERRMRYLIALWPLLALLAGAWPPAAGWRASSTGNSHAGTVADLRG